MQQFGVSSILLKIETCLLHLEVMALWTSTNIFIHHNVQSKTQMATKEV